MILYPFEGASGYSRWGGGDGGGRGGGGGREEVITAQRASLQTLHVPPALMSLAFYYRVFLLSRLPLLKLSVLLSQSLGGGKIARRRPAALKSAERSSCGSAGNDGVGTEWLSTQ